MMWSSSREVNELGETILLLVPIVGNSRRIEHKWGPASSHIGGLPYFHDDDSLLKNTTNPICTKCKRSMHLLIQLNTPIDDLDRTLYVFGCNQPSCHTPEIVNERDEFRCCFGESSPIRCYRSQRLWNESSRSSTVKDLLENQGESLELNDWGDDNWSQSSPDTEKGDTFKLAVGLNGKEKVSSTSMDDLEVMMSMCEMQATQKTTKSKQQSSKLIPKPKKISQGPIADEVKCQKIQSTTNEPSFTQYSLEMINEPIIENGNKYDKTGSWEDDDDDYEACGNDIDSNKVNQMLSRYLAIEDDECILAALRGDFSADMDEDRASGIVGGEGERYERLPPEEMAFFLFSERLKRAPQQVARYAYGGVPLWSVPLQSPIHCRHSKSKSNSHAKTSQSSQRCPTIPQCVCGANRVFEFQLLPSVLYVLGVDSSPDTSCSMTDDVVDLISTGGMNWGSIAVYSCTDSCNESREEFCVVQNGEDNRI